MTRVPWWGRLAGVVGLGFLTCLPLATPGATAPATPGTASPAKPGAETRARAVSGSPRALPHARSHLVRAHPGQPARVYGATPEGLFTSGDAGRSWAPVAIDGRHEEVFGLALHPTDPAVLIAGRRDGLRVSRDGGASWGSLAPPVPEPSIALAIAMADSQPDVLYVATARRGVFRSATGGSQWVGASQGLPASPDGTRPAEIRTLTVHPRSPDAAWVAHERLGVYRTTDGGASWQPENQGLPFPLPRRSYPPRFAFDPDDPDRLYVVFGEPVHSGLTMNRLYVRGDGGEWVPLEIDLPDNTPIRGLSVDRSTGVLTFWGDQGAWEVPLARSKSRSAP